MAKFLQYFFSIFVFIFLLTLSSCLTYYQRNAQFHQSFEQGNFEDAEKTLLKDSKAPQRKTKLLYYLNLGLVNSIMGKYAESNQYFEQAYMLGEDYQKNYLNEILSYFTNPMITEYKGEDFELLLVHYYKALNFLKLGDKEAALVECKRMNIKLNALSDKYDSNEKYKRDAFIHTLMGIIYEANGDINNAFIAYRNALDIYKEDYQKIFKLDIPEQLKKDLLRTAYLNGFMEDLQRYEEEFKMKHQPQPNTGDLVFLWHNGLGPIKSEWSINFTINRNYGAGQVIFVNDELGLNFNFPLAYNEDKDGKKTDLLGDLSVIRVAFPKYIERPLYFRSGSLQCESEVKELNLVEDLNAIAFKTLRQRMVLEIGKSLLRLAIKKAEEALLKKEKKDDLASILSVFNAIVEKADTRAWQTIPHNIYYTRLSLPAGQQKVQFNAQAAGGTKNFNFNFDIQKGKTLFHTFHSLEIDPRFNNYSYGY